MAAERADAQGGYLRGVLSDGARPFSYRARIRSLLGLPEDETVKVHFAPVFYGARFPYVRTQIFATYAAPDAPAHSVSYIEDEFLNMPPAPAWPVPSEFEAQAPHGALQPSPRHDWQAAPEEYEPPIAKAAETAQPAAESGADPDQKQSVAGPSAAKTTSLSIPGITQRRGTGEPAAGLTGTVGPQSAAADWTAQPGISPEPTPVKGDRPAPAVPPAFPETAGSIHPIHPAQPPVGDPIRPRPAETPLPAPGQLSPRVTGEPMPGQPISQNLTAAAALVPGVYPAAPLPTADPIQAAPAPRSGPVEGEQKTPSWAVPAAPALVTRGRAVTIKPPDSRPQAPPESMPDTPPPVSAPPQIIISRPAARTGGRLAFWERRHISRLLTRILR
jgi:hypothetical protein